MTNITLILKATDPDLKKIQDYWPWNISRESSPPVGHIVYIESDGLTKEVEVTG